MKVKTFFAIVFAALIVIFSLQNSEVTDVNFLVWKLSVSRVLIILGSFAFGVLIGILVSMKPSRKKESIEEEALDTTE